MFTAINRKRAGETRGFTLIELLIVLGIILLLASMLLPAVALARRHAKRAAARAEVKNLESAWRQYYSEYERWPSFVTGIDNSYCMSGTVARVIVQGSSSADNPRNLKFMDFKRVNVDGSPVSPWGEMEWDDDETYTAAAGPEDGAYFYWVKFDSDYDNELAGVPAVDVNVEDPASNRLQKSVIVWTVNPAFEPGDPEYIIGSWQ